MTYQGKLEVGRKMKYTLGHSPRGKHQRWARPDQRKKEVPAVSTKPMKTPRIVRVLITNEGQHLVAQCLQFDIVAQGKDLKGVMDNFVCTLRAHILNDTLDKLGTAPNVYWDRYAKAEQFKNQVPVRSKMRSTVDKSKINSFPEKAAVAYA
jgi:hypothetical protein